MKNSLVSIIVIFFESESYILKQMQSLKNITYDNIQLILVVGKSSDSTEKIIDQHIAGLEQKCESVKKVLVDGKVTPSKLLNNGLAEVEGEYFLQTDGDDYLEPNAISNMVDVFKNKSCSLVQGFAHDFDIESETLITKQQIDTSKKNTLLDILCGNNIIFNPGTRLIKTTAFKCFYPNMKIYESDEGQNWQVLIPFFLKGKCEILPETTLCVSKRPNSHSRHHRTLEESVARINEFKRIWIESIKVTGIRVEYDAVFEAYANHGFRLGYQFKNYEIAKGFLLKMNKPTLIQRAKLIKLKLGV